MGDASRILDGYAGSPVTLVAQVTLEPGDSIDLPADALRNGFGERILLDSLSWAADAQQSLDTTDPPTVTVGAPGASISATISLNGRQITGSFVPLYCLGTSIGQDVEHVVLAIATGGATACRLLGAVSSGFWRFDHPLDLLAGDALALHLTHTGLQNLPIVVSISVAGRMGEDLPRSRWIPYIASWLPPAIDPNTPTATVPVTVTSTERDLVNRAGQTIRVHRLIGRLLRQDVTLTPAATAYMKNLEQVFPTVDGTEADTPSTRLFANAVDGFLTMTVRDSGANDNVPVALPFRMVFEPESRAWECDADLESSGFYTVELTLDVPAIKDSAIQPAIALIGSYEV